MDVKPFSLTAADVSDLLVAIAKDPGYAVPKRVKPRPPKPDQPATFLERRRRAARSVGRAGRTSPTGQATQCAAARGATPPPLLRAEPVLTDQLIKKVGASH